DKLAERQSSGEKRLGWRPGSQQDQRPDQAASGGPETQQPRQRAGTPGLGQLAESPRPPEPPVGVDALGHAGADLGQERRSVLVHRLLQPGDMLEPASDRRLDRGEQPLVQPQQVGSPDAVPCPAGQLMLEQVAKAAKVAIDRLAMFL